MTRTSRPISARARILGAILAVACVGLGDRRAASPSSCSASASSTRSTTGCAPRSTVCSRSRAPAMRTRLPHDRGHAATAREELDRDGYTSVEEYLHAAVARLVPGRNEASRRDHRRRRRATAPRRCRASTSPQDDGAHRARRRRDRGDGRDGDRHRRRPIEGALRYIAIPVDDGGRPAAGRLHAGGRSGCRARAGDGSRSPPTAIAALAMLVAIAHRRLVRRRPPALPHPATPGDRGLHHDHRPVAPAPRRRATTTSPTSPAPSTRCSTGSRARSTCSASCWTTCGTS